MIADYINEAIIRFITTAGHYVRDDYIFYCKGNPVKYLTSEGQKRLLYFFLRFLSKNLLRKQNYMNLYFSLMILYLSLLLGAYNIGLTLEG